MSRHGIRAGSPFAPDVPLWGCEFTPGQVVAVGAAADRRGVRVRAAAPLAPGALVADLKAKNVVNEAAVRTALAGVLEQIRFAGSEIAVVIPDEAVQISLLNVETFPAKAAEQDAFVRWKLKKTAPIPLETARVAYQRVAENGGVDLLVAVTPEAVAAQYEAVVESLGLHAGFITPSTLAAFNLIDPPEDVIFVKANPESVTISVFADGRIRLYRRVAPQPLYDAVYPAFMFHQDKLGGRPLQGLVVTGVEMNEATQLGGRLSLPVRRLKPDGIDDVYKPALGAVRT